MPAAAIDLDALRKIASEFPEARLAVLFGSVARGTPAAWSDADIAILGLPYWSALELGSRLASELGREPHIVDLERAATRLRYLVAREGMLLHEEPGAWARFRAEAMLGWFDFEPIHALCVQGARRSLKEMARVG
jgi:predicted nucleotidyltransferase